MKKIVFVMIFSSFFKDSLRNRILNYFLNWEVSDFAKISRLAILNIKRVKMDPYSKIGAMTYAKGLDLLSMEEYSSIGRLNWITGFPSSNEGHFSQVVGREPALKLGRHSALTNRHLIDCTDCVVIGEYATFAGFRSQILTHSIDLVTSMQSCKPVNIGPYAFVGTGVVVLGGSVLPGRSVLAAGSTLNKKFVDENHLYGGCPARKIKELTDISYFDRKIGSVK